MSTRKPDQPITQSDLELAVKRHVAEALKRDRTKDVEILAAATAIVALLVSGYGVWVSSNQLHTAVDALNQSVTDSTNQDQRTRYEAVSAKLLERDSALVEHPQIIGYFWDNQPVPPDTDPDNQLVQAVATERVDFDEYAYTELENMSKGLPDHIFFQKDGPDPDWNAWSAMFIKDFSDSPAMCDTVQGRATQKSYNPDFIHALIEAKACPIP